MLTLGSLVSLSSGSEFSGLVVPGSQGWGLKLRVSAYGGQGLIV